MTRRSPQPARRKSLRLLVPLLVSLAATGCAPRSNAPVADAHSYPDSLHDGRRRLAIVDFGLPSRGAPGTIPFGTRTRHPVCGWDVGMIRDVARADSTDRDLSDFVEGEDVTFLLAVHPADARYRVIVTLGDPEGDRDPVTVEGDGRVIAAGVATRAGHPRQVSFDSTAPGRRLAFRIQAPPCRLFALVSVAVYGPPESRMITLPQTGPRDERPFVPPPDSLAATPEAGEPLRLLSTCVDFLLAHEPAERGFSAAGIWYQNAYPVRTLLAAARLTGKEEWREAAFGILDRFVAEQRPDGRWGSSYFGRAECAASVTPDTTSSNLADIGSMSTALAIAAAGADPERRERYLLSARRYADRIVLPDQLAGGAFPNRLYAGVDNTTPYSVATATQATSLAALGLVTGENRYLEAADRAALWLAARFLPSGLIILHPHDGTGPRLIRGRDFGDSFYLVEALIWVERGSRDPHVRRACRDALRRLLDGPEGLIATRQHDYWWEPPGVWNASKAGGMLELLAFRRHDHPDAATTLWIERATRWMADPLLRQRVGITANPWMPNGEFSLVATGFAGVGLASLADYDSIFPDSRRSPSLPGLEPEKGTSGGVGRGRKP